MYPKITDSQIEKWSKKGKDEMSKQTYDVFKEILTKMYPYAEIRLQGSYSNHTNVKDNSDIDILLEFKPDDITKIGTDVNLCSLKSRIHRQINHKNNFDLIVGPKTIKYKGNSTYVPVDIVPCVDCGDYIKFVNTEMSKTIISYPHQHHANGVTKSQLTDQNFKKTVRMFKNARNYLVYKNILAKDRVPSYFLECLLYNVPNSYFKGNDVEIFDNTLNWLCRNKNNMCIFKKQNEVE